MTGPVGAGRPTTPDQGRLRDQQAEDARAQSAANPDAGHANPDAGHAGPAADAHAAAGPRTTETTPAAGREDGDARANPTMAPPTSAWMLGPASADVVTGPESSRLPGQHRGGFSRLPTAPVDVTVRSGPEPDTEATWVPAPQAGPQRGLAGWALMFAVLGLAVSMFVGWGFPIGLVGLVSGILALRRPTESRALGGWAVVLATASLIYSAGWLWFAAGQANLLG